MEKKVKFLQIIAVILAVALIAITVTFSVLYSQSKQFRWYDNSYSQVPYSQTGTSPTRYYVYGVLYNGTDEYLDMRRVTITSVKKKPGLNSPVSLGPSLPAFLAPKSTCEIKFEATSVYEKSGKLQSEFTINYLESDGTTSVLCFLTAVFD